MALVVKNPSVKAGDTKDADSVPGSPGGGTGNPLQYSCLENSMDRATWRATVYGVAMSRIRPINGAQPENKNFSMGKMSCVQVPEVQKLSC